MNTDNIYEEYEKKVVAVLRQRQDEIVKHYSESKDVVKRHLEDGIIDEEDFKKTMRKLERSEFYSLHELDILATKFRGAGVIDYRTDIWE